MNLVVRENIQFIYFPSLLLYTLVYTRKHLSFDIFINRLFIFFSYIYLFEYTVWYLVDKILLKSFDCCSEARSFLLFFNIVYIFFFIQINVWYLIDWCLIVLLGLYIHIYIYTFTLIVESLFKLNADLLTATSSIKSYCLLLDRCPKSHLINDQSLGSHRYLH